MALIQSDWAKGLLPVARPHSAWAVHAQLFIVNVPAAGFAANDILELAVLPPYARIVGAKLVTSGVDDEATVDVGLMSGTTGELLNDDDTARTCGTELFAAADITEEVTFISTAASLLIKPTENDRSIGVKFSAAVAAGADKQLGLLLHFAQ